MKSALVWLACLSLVSCFGAPKHSANVERFFKDAKERASTGNNAMKMDLKGLRFTLGSLPNSKGTPRDGEDSVLVSDEDTAIRQAVQIVVKPGVGVSLPAQEASPEFLERFQRDTAKALQRSRYVSVQLGQLPDPGEPDTTPIPAPDAEESIRVIEHASPGDEPGRTLYATYGSAKDRRFVQDLVQRLRGSLESLDGRDYLGPDSGFTEVQIHSQGASWRLRSWHPQHENRDTIATAAGLEPLNGRSREEVEEAQPKPYQDFRQVFDTTLSAMKARR